MMTKEHGMAGEFSIRDEEAPVGMVAFSVLKDGAVFQDFGINHTKEMHLIALREDLQYFHHLHPERDASGVWRIAFVPEAAGVYRFYADFVDRAGNNYALRFQKAFPGNPGTDSFQPDFTTKKSVGAYTVEFLPPLTSASGIEYGYRITDAEGHDVPVEQYLGAQGHSVLISPSGDYIHTHPHEEYEGFRPTDAPQFVVPIPKDPYYRIFTEFQVAGKVFIVVFDWKK